jgi:hypothetical protein
MFHPSQPGMAFRKCAERTSDSCGDETDGCCAIIPCTYCLEFLVYGHTTIEGAALSTGYGWAGLIAGATFYAYWERSLYGDCEFVVELADEEIYRRSCYEGASCRNSSDEVDVTIGYTSGVLRWTRREQVPLPYNREDGCVDWFCGECECTCERLCVTVTRDAGGGNLFSCKDFISVDSSYDCPQPQWSGDISCGAKSYAVLLELLRDPYDGACLLGGTINGEELTPVRVESCTAMTASFTLTDGDVISVACAVCSCETIGCPCCPDWPQTASASITWISINVPSDCNSTATPQVVAGDFGCNTIAEETGTIIFIDSNSLRVRVFCDPETTIWSVQYKSPATSTWPGPGLGSEDYWQWVDVVYDFSCPACSTAVDGIATGTIDFVARMRCETSGGIVDYDIIVHGDVEIVCP